MSQILEVREGVAKRAKAAEKRVEEIVGAGFDVGKFVENFEVIAEAAGGVERLKEFVLDLAVRGLLCDQRSSDEPASGLLLRIRQTQIQAEQRGQVERVGPSAPIEADELPHRLRAGWAWTRLAGAMLTIQIGPFGSLLHKSDYVNGGTPLINPAHIKNGRIVPEAKKGVAPGTLKRLDAYRLRSGDVVMGRRGEMGKCAVITSAEDGWLCGTGSLFVRPTKEVVAEFVALWLRSPLVRARLEGESVGSTMNNLNLRILNNLVLGLPPLGEQKRIVANVEQLTALCDDLEARQTRKRDTGARLTKSALEALTTAEGPLEFDAAWKRVVENFEVLFWKSSSVAAVRDLVLELAFRGALVEGVPGDTPAALRRKQVEAAWAGRKRKEALPEVHADERPASPDRWSWVRIGNLAEIVGGVTKGRALRGRQLRSYPYLRVANVQRGHLDLSTMKEIEIPEEELAKYALLPGDILFTEGGDWDKLGRSCVWHGEINPCIHQNHVFRARLLGDLDPTWFSLYANSPVGRRYFEDAAKQTTNLASVNMTQLRDCAMPVPPIMEQKAIVAKIERLAKVCDDLEAKLRRSEDRAAQFAEALVQELVVA